MRDGWTEGAEAKMGLGSGVQAKQASPIDDGLSLLSRNLESAYKALEVLTSRLSPALAPEAPSNDREKAMPARGSSSVSERLNQINVGLVALSERVGSLIQRIEL